MSHTYFSSRHSFTNRGKGLYVGCSIILYKEKICNMIPVVKIRHGSKILLRGEVVFLTGGDFACAECSYKDVSRLGI